MKLGTKHTKKSKEKMRSSRLGMRLSEETRKKMSILRTKQWRTGIRKGGFKLSEETKTKIGIGNKGKHTLTPEHKYKLWLSNKGKRVSLSTIKKISKSNTGKKLSEETKNKIRAALLKNSHWKGITGKNHPSWKGGKDTSRHAIMGTVEYKLWRKSVFERDRYTCIWCGDNKGGNLEADHIKPFSLFPELRFAIDNGRTLCKDCHRTTETYGNKLKKWKIE